MERKTGLINWLRENLGAGKTAVIQTEPAILGAEPDLVLQIMKGLDEYKELVRLYTDLDRDLLEFEYTDIMKCEWKEQMKFETNLRAIEWVFLDKYNLTREEIDKLKVVKE